MKSREFHFLLFFKLIKRNLIVLGIEEPLFWKPQGNLITFSQQLPNKHVISFMERNGLKHGDFVLPGSMRVSPQQ